MTWKPLPAEKEDPEPTTIAESVREWAREYSAGDVDAWQSIIRDWRSLVGDDLADHCEPHSLRDGELVIVVDDSAWLSQLAYLSEQLKAKLNSEVSGASIETVKTRVRPAPPAAR